MLREALKNLADQDFMGELLGEEATKAEFNRIKEDEARDLAVKRRKGLPLAGLKGSKKVATKNLNR